MPLFTISAQSAVPHVSIDSEVLKFGYCTPNQLSESKVLCFFPPLIHKILFIVIVHHINVILLFFQLVSITNHTQGTVCCSWVTGKRQKAKKLLKLKKKVFKLIVDLCILFPVASDPFVVMPGEQEILPGQTAPFSFSFKPVSGA